MVEDKRQRVLQRVIVTMTTTSRTTSDSLVFNKKLDFSVSNN